MPRFIRDAKNGCHLRRSYLRKEEEKKNKIKLGKTKKEGRLFLKYPVSALIGSYLLLLHFISFSVSSYQAASLFLSLSILFGITTFLFLNLQGTLHRTL